MTTARFFSLVAILAVSACSNRPPDDSKDYMATIAEARASKDRQFQEEKDPVPADKKSVFLPLAYFPIDPEYKVVAGLTQASERVDLLMPTSTGRMRTMLRIGTLTFVLKGQQTSLLAFTEKFPNGSYDLSHLFVPFGDLTNGTETYAAGRFLDLDRTGTNLYELDFNRAYIPYCYYNASFECPYPPPENRLKIPIHAGERMKPTA